MTGLIRNYSVLPGTTKDGREVFIKLKTTNELKGESFRFRRDMRLADAIKPGFDGIFILASMYCYHIS